MPKAAPSAKNQEKQVSEATFLAALRKKSAAAKAAAKAQRPERGFMDDLEILTKLDIGPGERKSFAGQLSKVSFGLAKNDANRPMFRFFYQVVDENPKYNGTTVSNMHILEEKKEGQYRGTLQEVEEDFFFELQALGEDTAKYKDPLVDGHAAGKRLTAEKPAVSLTIEHWVGKTDPTKQGMRVYVNGLLTEDNSDIGEPPTDEQPVDEQVEEQQEEEATEGETSLVEAAEGWFGIWVEFGYEGYPDGVRMKIEGYDADTNRFFGVSDAGEEWSGEYGPAFEEGAFVQSELQD